MFQRLVYPSPTELLARCLFSHKTNTRLTQAAYSDVLRRCADSNQPAHGSPKLAQPSWGMNLVISELTLSNRNGGHTVGWYLPTRNTGVPLSPLSLWLHGFATAAG